MKTPRYIEVDGLKLPSTFDPDTCRKARQFKPEKGRIVVATFPKCGTTWMLQIVSLILKKGVPPANAKEYFDLEPFMEMTPLSQLQNLPEEGCIKTHLPFHHIHFSPDVKYIYVARHPQDCLVSYYHHVRYFNVYFFSDGTLDDLFEAFIRGETEFGDYFDHLLSWHEQRHRPNVLFLTFESLKADPRGTILKVAKFMGEEHYETLLAGDGKVLEDVLQYSSLDFMKKTVDKYWEEMFGQEIPEEVQAANPVLRNLARLSREAREAGHESIGHFVRKGAVGDGKIALTAEQKDALERRMQEKCGNTDVINLWK